MCWNFNKKNYCALKLEKRSRRRKTRKETETWLINLSVVSALEMIPLSVVFALAITTSITISRSVIINHLSQQKGFSTKRCFEDRDCGFHQCLSYHAGVQGTLEDCNKRDNCHCFSLAVACSSLSSCSAGDICTKVGRLPDRSVCVPAFVIEQAKRKLFGSRVKYGVYELSVTEKTGNFLMNAERFFDQPSSTPVAPFNSEKVDNCLNPTSLPKISQGVSRLPRDRSESGLSYEICKKDESSFCQSPRRCIDIEKSLTNDSYIECTESSFNCLCLQEKVRSCSPVVHCEQGERCMTDKRFSPFCVSCKASIVGLEEEDGTFNNCSVNATPRPPFPLASSEATYGLTGDICTSAKEDCKDGRSCLSITGELCSADSSFCICTGLLTACESSDACVKGERCIETGKEPTRFCGSCNHNFKNGEFVDEIETNCDYGADPEESPNESPDVQPTPEICISVEALSHISKADLIYAEDIKSTVLCDNDNNCATSGHMVIWNGMPMMMRSYCNLVLYGCKRQIRFVNSPRMKRKTSIPSNSKLLRYSALSARFQTSLEERLLRILILYGV